MPNDPAGDDLKRTANTALKVWLGVTLGSLGLMATGALAALALAVIVVVLICGGVISDGQRFPTPKAPAQKSNRPA